ncbi:MAG: DUF2284 domain-containing protein [Clostridia bacterium]|nr:DUF2284 domain-containing protein [Clostridia bacterium]
MSLADMTADLNMEALAQAARKHGFDHAAALDPSAVRLRAEVRDMCASNKCGRYGACWTCPPACGELALCEARLRAYSRGLIVQTVGLLEDSLDFEGMQEAERRHKAMYESFADELRKRFPGLLALGTGGCSICERCAYPDAPCRFPERAFSSMEAYGMLVTDVCAQNGLSYYYGPNTIAYTACYLLD